MDHADSGFIMGMKVSGAADGRYYKIKIPEITNLYFSELSYEDLCQKINRSDVLLFSLDTNPN